MSTVTCRICDFENPPGEARCVRCGTPIPSRFSSTDETRAASESSRSAGLKQGQIIGNRFEVLGEIGRGGMGSIYRARDNTLREEVALKTLLPQFVSDEHVVQRFFNEARITRQLSHPNVVRVHDIGASQNIVYISMELLHGKSLRQLIDEQLPGDRIPIRQVLDIFESLAAALEYAHLYTVHRDIKPENVMVLTDGTVKLMDFGISKLKQAGNLTSDSMVMGTPHYMSPEQVKHSASVDARADIYSLGVMLYEVLTGNLPTAIHKPVSQISRGVPPALDPVVETCLQDDPARRYQTASELREALEEVREQVDETGAGSLGRASRRGARRGRRRVSVKKIAGLVLIGVILAGTVWGLVRAEAARQQILGEYEQSAVGTESLQETLVEIEPSPLDAETALVLLPAAARRAETAVRLNGAEDAGDYLSALFDDAEAWRQASEPGLEEGAAESVPAAMQALHRYAAILHWRDGLIFIPPGDRPAEVPGFYAGAEPVGAAAFRKFAESEPWRMPVSSGSACVGVAYYDAMAYAASRPGHFRIPTADQLRRAFNFAVEEESVMEAGNEADDTDSSAVRMIIDPELYEWTSTLEDGRAAESATFNDKLIVLNAVLEDDDTVRIAEDSQRFQDGAADIGFRIVEVFPTTNEGLHAMLGQ